VISAAENSNKFQRTRFGKEKSIKEVIILDEWHMLCIISLLVTRCEASSSIRFSPFYYHFFSSGAGKLIILVHFYSHPTTQGSHFHH
jgi:hypothetical protein